MILQIMAFSAGGYENHRLSLCKLTLLKPQPSCSREGRAAPLIMGHTNFYHMSYALPGLSYGASLSSNPYLPIQFHIFYLPVHYNSHTDTGILIGRISQGEDLQLFRCDLASILWELQGLQSHTSQLTYILGLLYLVAPPLESNSSFPNFSRLLQPKNPWSRVGCFAQQTQGLLGSH